MHTDFVNKLIQWDEEKSYKRCCIIPEIGSRIGMRKPKIRRQEFLIKNQVELKLKLSIHTGT